MNDWMQIVPSNHRSLDSTQLLTDISVKIGCQAINTISYLFTIRPARAAVYKVLEVRTLSKMTFSHKRVRDDQKPPKTVSTQTTSYKLLW